MEATLAGVNGEQLGPALRAAARFAQATTPAQYLDRCVADSRSLESILGLMDGLDHVGFLAPAEVAPRVPAAAAEAGFDRVPHSFESTILARHLAQLAERERVPTSIFKARGAFDDAGVIGVEVAMPAGVSRTVLRDWIAAGVGTHVAFRVTDPGCFADLTTALTAVGYRMPDFTGGAPLSNPAEKLEALFFDRRPAEPVGLEFCFYGPSDS